MYGLFRNLALLGLLLHAVAAVARVPDSGVQTRSTLPRVAAQLIVRLEAGAVPNDAAQILSPFAAVVLAQLDAADLVLLGIDDDANVPAAIALAAADPRIGYAEPNFVHRTSARPNDLDFSRQWAKDNTGINAPNGLGTPGADLNLVAAWDAQATAANVVVAIIDDAVETSHLDLVSNVLPTGRCFASPGSTRPCSNGPNDPNPADDGDFHGTLVAGTVGARGNNGIGIAGSAWVVGLLPLKVDLSVFAIVQAVDEALAQNAHIINMSFGGPGNSAALEEALARARDAGVLVVAAAGNADASNDRAVHFPSDSPQPNVLSIAASNATDQVASFSQWGGLSVDLAAPGELVLTTALGNAYAAASGTSFAAPHVAGVAALVRARSGIGGYAPLVASLLYGGVEGVSTLGPVVPGQDKQAVPGRVAAGRLDAARALSGPPGPVLLIDAITIDDTLSGNGNGQLDPGETATLQITLRNVWQDAVAVSGILSTVDSATLSINDSTPVLFGNVAQDTTATAAFSVTLSAGVSGYINLFVQLDLAAAGTSALPSRYAYVGSGRLDNGVVLTQAIQRWDWDEFHAFHVDVPAGASQLDVATSGSGDVDLLLRHAQAPAYLITLNAPARGSDGFYYVDDATLVSGGAGANESISVTNPLPGTWHAVVVNYDQVAKDYAVSASYSAPGSDVIRLSSASYSVAENAGNVALTVTRSGGLPAASVRIRSAAGTATAGNDYVELDTVLTWAAGENGSRTVNLSVLDDTDNEASETVTVTLSEFSGAGAGTPVSATVTISDDDPAPPVVPVEPTPAGNRGGGGAITILAVLGGLCLAASRSRRDHRNQHKRLHVGTRRRQALALTNR